MSISEDTPREEMNKPERTAGNSQGDVDMPDTLLRPTAVTNWMWPGFDREPEGQSDVTSGPTTVADLVRDRNMSLMASDINLLIENMEDMARRISSLEDVVLSIQGEGSLRALKGKKRTSLEGIFNDGSITDEDIEEAKKLWQIKTSP